MAFASQNLSSFLKGRASCVMVAILGGFVPNVATNIFFSSTYASYLLSSSEDLRVALPSLLVFVFWHSQLRKQAASRKTPAIVSSIEGPRS